MKIRIKFSKTGSMKFIGHLDMMRYFQKAIRRAEIDIAYSSGFSPHQIMSFAAPLSVGHTSSGEYFDIEVNSYKGAEDIRQRLNRVMVDGIEILDAALLEESEKNAMASVAAAEYLITFREGVLLPKDWSIKLIDFYSQEKIPVIKKTKKGEREVDLKEGIYELSVREDNAVYLLVHAGSGENIKPDFVLETFFLSIGESPESQEGTAPGGGLPPYAMQVHRIETYQYAGKDENLLVPLIANGRTMPYGKSYNCKA